MSAVASAGDDALQCGTRIEVGGEGGHQLGGRSRSEVDSHVDIGAEPGGAVEDRGLSAEEEPARAQAVQRARSLTFSPLLPQPDSVRCAWATNRSIGTPWAHAPSHGLAVHVRQGAAASPSRAYSLRASWRSP